MSCRTLPWVSRVRRSGKRKSRSLRWVHDGGCDQSNHGSRTVRAHRGGRADRRGGRLSTRCGRAAPDAAPVPRGRQRPADHAGTGARRDRRPASRRHAARDDQRHRRPADGEQAGPDDPAARRHGRPADARGHRASTSRRSTTARCTPAATTPTRRCSSARPGCCRAHVDELAGRVLFMFQPGEEGHHGARFMLDEGLLDVPRARRRHAVARHGRVRTAHHVGAAERMAQRPRRPDHGLGRHAAHRRRRARAATPASRTARSTRSRSPARSSRRCRRWSPARSTCSTRRWSRSARSRPARRTTSSPRPREIRGHDPRRQRGDPCQGPRRHPPRRRRHRRGPRRVGRRRRSTPGYPVTVNDDAFADNALGVARDRRRRGQRRRAAPPGHGRRGLQLRAAAGARDDDVPRRHPARPRPRRRRRRTTPTGCTSTSRRWPAASRPTRPWPSIISRPAKGSAAGRSRCDRAHLADRDRRGGRVECGDEPHARLGDQRPGDVDIRGGDVPRAEHHRGLRPLPRPDRFT